MYLYGIVEIMKRGEKLVGMIDWPQPRYLLLEEREEFKHICCQHNLWQETFAKDKSHLKHGKLGKIKDIMINLKENGKSLIPLSFRGLQFFLLREWMRNKS
jgi:hypothetical protein